MVTGPGVRSGKGWEKVETGEARELGRSSARVVKVPETVTGIDLGRTRVGGGYLKPHGHSK